MSKRRAGGRKSTRRSEARSGAAEPGHTPTWRYWAGRWLQMIGMLILPFGIASELMGKVGLGQSLLIAGGGILAFYIGFVIQHGDTART